MKRTVLAATALALAVAIGGCGGDGEPEADPPPTSADPSSPSATSTAEPTWDDEFGPAQLKRYRAARDRWLEFWDFYTEIARKGVDTPGVKSGFEKYTTNPRGERSRFLDTYVRGDVRLEVPPVVLWTSAEKIKKNRINFNYCLDSTNSRTVNTDGDVAPKRKPLRRLMTVQMVNVEGWRRVGFLHAEKVRPCGKTAP